MNYGFLAIVIIAIFLVILKLISETEEDEIKYRIEKMGGKILSIEQDKSYIREVNKIEKKKRFYISEVFKVNYTLDGKEKVAYVVVYRSYFMIGSNNWKRDWIEKP